MNPYICELDHDKIFSRKRKSSVKPILQRHQTMIESMDLETFSDCEEDIKIRRKIISEIEPECEPEGSTTPYVCPLHDPKFILEAEQIFSSRVEIRHLKPRPRSASSSSTKCTPARSQESTYSMFTYMISIKSCHAVFECAPDKLLKVYRALLRDPQIGHQLHFIETRYFRGGLLSSMKRLWSSPEKISSDIAEILSCISDIDAVLSYPSYLILVGAKEGTELLNEIKELVLVHQKQSRLTSNFLCQCDTYKKCLDHFGDFCSKKLTRTCSVASSSVLSEPLMISRGLLAFYSDTVFVLDKRDFCGTRGLKSCVIYGFGRQKLFEVVRVARRKWAFRQENYGDIFTLTMKRYVHGMHFQPMVRIKRVQQRDLSQKTCAKGETVCFVKKSKRFGYRCILLSEVITQGKVTTSLSIERQQGSTSEDPHYHYITTSEVSGSSRERVTSSKLSVPQHPHSHLQRLQITGGSDVLTFLALAASYDILVRTLRFWLEKKY